MRTVRINGEDYEEIPAHLVATSKLLADTFVQLGRPTDPLSETGKKMVRVIVASWEDLYPKQSANWYAARRDHLNAELSISEQVSKRTGRSLGSYPGYVYTMLKKLFPTTNLTERKFMMKMVREFPVFRFANKI